MTAPYDFWTPVLSNYGNPIRRSPAIQEILERAGIVKFAPMVTTDEHIRTLYCIGGSLDGKVITGKVITETDRFVVNVPIGADQTWFTEWQDYARRPLHRREWYKRRYFHAAVNVQFFVLSKLPHETFIRRARELYVEAAVLQDEQLICE